MTDLPPDLEALLFDAAAGDLTPEDAERLRELVDADPTIAELVAEQRTTADRLAVEPLSELERAGMHRAVRAATAPEPAAPAPWVRWAFAAAAVVLVVVAGGFALLNSGLNGSFDDVAAEIESAPTDIGDGGGDETDRSSADEAEEAAADGEADTALAPEAGDDAEDSAAGGFAAFPACPGEVESIDDVDDATEAMTEAWPSPEAAAAALDDVPDTWTLYAGDPVIETFGDVAVLSWSDDGGLLQQVELRGTGDLWSASRRITCSR